MAKIRPRRLRQSPTQFGVQLTRFFKKYVLKTVTQQEIGPMHHLKHCYLLVMLSLFQAIVIASSASASAVLSCKVTHTFSQFRGGVGVGDRVPCHDVDMTACSENGFAAWLKVGTVFELPMDNLKGDDLAFAINEPSTSEKDFPEIFYTITGSISRVDGSFWLRKISINTNMPYSPDPKAIEDASGNCDKRDVHTKF
jgi:hypothetical protein